MQYTLLSLFVNIGIIFNYFLKADQQMNNFWNNRYSVEEYIYGKEPNKFLQETLELLTPRKVLFVGEGEGRNSVFAAERGWYVDALDSSSVAMEKALKLASEKNVKINYQLADVRNYHFEEQKYDLVALIYLHLQESERAELHQKIIRSLRNDGIVLLEAFEKSQINNNTGGPQNTDLLYTLEDIINDFIDLDFVELSKTSVHLAEGSHHNGNTEIIRFIGKKII